MITRFSVALFVWFALLNAAEAQSVGRTPGKFDVSPIGSAQYSIPIWAPPGPRGMQPNLSLLYDSGSSIGPLGIGWSLAGLGAITRCNLTTAQDTTPAPVALVTTDGYCMNGKRLRLTGGTYGAAGSTYQTEIADFSQITAVSNTTSGGVNTGPASFTVQGRNGLTYYYGFTDSNGNGANSQALAWGSTTALSWFLSKIVDRSGNNLVINYLPQTGPSPTSPTIALSGTTVPAKILWTPASAGSSTYTYTMQFNYSASPNAPQSSINEFVAGTPVVNAELLTSIEILIGTATVVKDYLLTYQASPLTERNELIKVQECADSAGSNCLLPTTISYQSGSPGLSTVSNSALTSSGALLSARYDLNGDGYPDLVYLSGTTVYVAFGSASGYGAPVSTGISGLHLIGKITGGSQDGILAVSSGVWWYYTWNGSNFVGASTGLAYDSTATQYQLADVDGDGRTDLVALYITGPFGPMHKYTATVYTRLNTSSGGTPSFSSTLNTAYTIGTLVSAQLLTPDFQYAKLRRYDFNGDGRDDVVLQTITGTSPSYTVNTYELISTGTTFNSTLIQSAAASSYPSMFFTDWNDDKCTDVVTFGTLYVSGCNGTVPASYAIGTVVAAIDYDGDGRTDLMVANGSTLGVYLSKATGAPTLTTTSIPYVSTCQYVWMDANGDGQDDLGCWSQTGSNPLTYYLHNGTSDLATSFADGYGNSASPTYIPLSEGNYTENYYNATFPDQDYIGPMNVVSSVVYSDPSAAPGTTFNQSFWYYGGWINLQGRGFEGFGATRTLDSRNGLYDYKYYSTVFPYTGMQFQEILSNSTFYPSERTGTEALTTLSSTLNQQRYFPYFSNWTSYKWEVGGPENSDLITTTSTNYTFDNYGNATNIVKTVTDNDPGSPYNGDTWTTNTTNTTDISVNQSADLAQWCLTMLDETQVVYSSTINGTNTVTRSKTFTLDTPTNCRIVSAVTEPTANSGLYKVTEALTFDSFGNIHTDTVTGANMPSSPASRLTTLNWGTTGQFLNSATDPSGATSTDSYTSNQSLTFGVPDSVTNANNLTTSWLYDPFGRKSKETRPDGTSTTWSWSTCTSFCGWSNSFYQIAQTNYQTNGSTVIRTDTNYYDPIDRVTLSYGPNVTGPAVYTTTLYNSLGLISKQLIPFVDGAPAYYQSYGYDTLNRLSSVSRPISSTISTLQTTNYGYAGRTFTVKDPYGNTKTIIKDVNGWLRQTKDPIGYNVTRAFDAAGSLTGVTDSVGNTLLSGVTYKYGLKPFRVAATDADRGAWAYTVDSLGERIGWTDAKSPAQSFTMTYDALSRPLTRTEPDQFTQWTWGSTPASHNMGQLISECTGTTGSPPTSCGTTPTYQETRTFDSLGRPSTRAITESGNPGNDPGGVFLFTNTYSATTGLPNTLTYPTSTSSVALNIQYGYQNGLLQSVTDTTDTTTTCGSTCTLWTANAMNGFGEITQETLGNGVVMNRSYDAVTSWLSAATAGVGGGATLLNQSYLEDENGNIIQRQNNNAGLTESFAYDADQRLTCAALSSTCTTATLAYDGGVAGPGNITSQTGVGTYTYPAAGQPRPHAVTSLTGTFNGITNPSFVYDANGNMTSRAGSTVTWSSYNYPTNINANDATGAEEVQLSYGPDRQRWKQIYTAPGTTENTYYIGGLLEKVLSGSTTNYRHYIYAGREAVAVYSRTAAGVNTMSYMLEDHQGGVSNIASNSGTSDVNESFSAFGTRRNPTTWSGAPTTGDLNTIAGLSRQGYTFQTWLGQSMGLNHMNGRVEDAILGRFLSPDPHITDPSNAQNYNRYSYVLNNPLSYVDPSGFDDCLLLGLNCPGGGEQVIPGGQSPDPSTPSPTITPGNLPDSLPGIDGMPEITVTGCGGIGVTCYDPSTWVQSPGVNTAPGLPLIPFDPSKLDTVTVTAQSGKPCMNTASTGTGPVPVVLNDGSTIPDANLPGGLLLQPADVSLSANAAIGQFSSDMDNRDATMLALFVPGGLMDYQRSYGSNGLINPTYIDFGNFNFGVVAAAMGYNQAQALAGAGLANLLGRGNKSGPFFTNPRNNVFINAGYSAFISGRIGC